MAIKSYSTTAASNNSAPPAGAPEGMSPGSVNDTIRQIMADIRSWYEDVEWRDHGHTVTRTGNTTFAIPTDVTAIYIANRPIRCTDSSTLYGYVASSSYGAPDTTVTVTLDSGNLSASLTAVSLGPTPTTQSIPVQAIRYQGTALLANSALWTGSPNFQGAVNYAATAGTDTYTATLAPALTAYTTGAHYYISFGNANATTTPTLNLNGLGAKTIVKDGSAALAAGDIPASHKGVLMYDGTNMVLLNPKNQAAAAAQGSSMVLLDSQTASSSAQIDLTTGIDSTYDEYEIHFVDVRPATDGVTMYVRVSTDGGSTFKSGASDYKLSLYSINSDNTVTQAASTATDRMQTGSTAAGHLLANAASSTHNGVIKFYVPSSSSKVKFFMVDSMVSTTQTERVTGHCMYNATTAINAIRFVMSSGNIAEGSFYLYGIKKA